MLALAQIGEDTMPELLNLVLEAHGGIERWRTFDIVRATFVSSGGLLPMKGLDVTPSPSEGVATIHQETLRIDGYRRPEWRMRFTPDRVVVETMNAEIVEERTNPRESFVGHTLTTPWDLMQVAYFNGYARWTYLTTPFFMAMPGFQVTEIEPWKEGSEIWRGLRVRFPPSITSHSTEQEFYFGPDLLLRRHDYRLEIAGGPPIAQYVHDIIEADGFRFPSKRRAYPRGPGSKAIRDLLLTLMRHKSEATRPRAMHARCGRFDAGSREPRRVAARGGPRAARSWPER